MTVSRQSAIVLIVLTVIISGMGVPSTGGFIGTAQAQASDGPIDVDASDLPGDGSGSNPYEISNVSELQAMEDDLDANYELVSDVDASQTGQFNDGHGFDPIGSFEDSPTQSFKGSLDGNNNTITGLTINRPTDSGIGLFRFTDSEATITHLTLSSVTATGKNAVGGLVGSNRGNITDATASGDVTGEELVGGLVGFNNGTSADAIIRSAQVSGSVTGGEGPVGGLAGGNRGGVIQNVRASGSVTGDVRESLSVGGLVGFNNGTVQTARASGSVTGEQNVGGLVGQNGGGAGNVTIRDTFAVGSVTGNQDVGGLIGLNFATVEQSYFDTEATGQSASAGNPTGLTTTEMQGSAAEQSMPGLEFGESWQTVSGDYPELIAVSDLDSASGSESDSDFQADFLIHNGQIATDNAQITFTGSAPGKDEVIVVFVGPGGQAIAQPLSVDDNDTFGKDNFSLAFRSAAGTLSEGTVSAHIISAGPDDVFGDNFAKSESTFADIIATGRSGPDDEDFSGNSNTGTQIRELILANSVDDTASDDLLATEVFQFVTVEQQEEAIDVSRTVSSGEVAPTETVTLTTEITGANGTVSIESFYDPQMTSATVQTTVNGEVTDPLVSAATGSGSTVTLGDVGTNATVTVTEELTVGEELNVTHNITGDVTLESAKIDFEPVSVTVADRDTEPQSVVDEFDEDGNGNINIIELGQAGQAFASGELSITELGQVGAAFAS